MDLLSRIAGWLGENEATISAVVGIAVLSGIVLAGQAAPASARAGVRFTDGAQPERRSAA